MLPDSKIVQKYSCTKASALVLFVIGVTKKEIDDLNQGSQFSLVAYGVIRNFHKRLVRCCYYLDVKHITKYF